MTSGGNAGTSGDKGRPSFGAWWSLAAVGMVVASVNATTEIIDWQRTGYHGGALFEPFLWELTSLAALLAMAPMVGRALARWPLEKGHRLLPHVAIHLGLTVPFSAVHIAAFLILRLAAYALLHRPYDYFSDGAGIVFFYEWRKDALTYALIIGVYWLFARLRAPAAENAIAPDEPIAIRDGGRTVYLKPADIAWVEAAGNYVEIHSGAQAQLVRGTLKQWEAQLASLGFARIHRSRLVNRAHVAAVKTTPSGDYSVTLRSGETLAGSRRHRLD